MVQLGKIGISTSNMGFNNDALQKHYYDDPEVIDPKHGRVERYYINRRTQVPFLS